MSNQLELDLGNISPPIDILELSPRITNMLKNDNINTIDNLVQKIDDNCNILLRYKYIGRKTFFRIIKKLEESKSSKLYKAKKYKLPKIVTTILRQKASEINKLFMGKEKFNIFNDHFNENIYTTISDIYRKAQVLIYEEYEEQMNDINRKSTERRVFSQKMKDFCLVQVEKHCEKLKSKIKEKNFNNKNIENLIEKTNDKEKNPIKIKKDNLWKRILKKLKALFKR